MIKNKILLLLMFAVAATCKCMINKVTILPEKDQFRISSSQPDLGYAVCYMPQGVLDQVVEQFGTVSYLPAHANPENTCEFKLPIPLVVYLPINNTTHVCIEIKSDGNNITFFQVLQQILTAWHTILFGTEDILQGPNYYRYDDQLKKRITNLFPNNKNCNWAVTYQKVISLKGL